MESTEASIAVFNKTLRRLRLVTLLTLVIAAIALAIAVTARGPQAEVRARAFVLVDDSGEVLARLAKVKDGPVLVLHARRAGADVLIGSAVDDAGIAITVNGQPRLTLLTGRDGYPSLGIRDAKGGNRLLIGLDKKDAPSLMLRRENGSPALIARAGDPMVQFLDEQNKVVLSLPTQETTRASRRK
ncbi:MAG: hypothetical protein E6J63_18715 [Deltaproteobacteria bacterium]|nr:MAG: hypothetical protein E6J63_18715 [Deltaproteobacteria bacterium]